MESEIIKSFKEKQREYVIMYAALASDLLSISLASLQEATETILEKGIGFINEEECEELRSFYNMYKEKSEELIEKSEKVNKDVDNIVDDLLEKADAGEEIDYEESEEQKDDRLGLSGMQKQLESVARLNKGLKEKTYPLILELQCEDILTQKVSHLKANI